LHVISSRMPHSSGFAGSGDLTFRVMRGKSGKMWQETARRDCHPWPEVATSPPTPQPLRGKPAPGRGKRRMARVGGAAAARAGGDMWLERCDRDRTCVLHCMPWRGEDQGNWPLIRVRSGLLSLPRPVRRPGLPLAFMPGGQQTTTPQHAAVSPASLAVWMPPPPRPSLPFLPLTLPLLATSLPHLAVFATHNTKCQVPWSGKPA